MIQFLKKQGWNLLNSVGLGASAQLYLESALKQYGWFQSFTQRMSIDATGNPIPWYTYSFIFFLESRLKQDFRVFEYGSGNSTRWYSQRIKSIVAVEHDHEWIETIAPQLPANVQLIERKLDQSYIRSVGDFGDKFDVIVVDGRKRVKCVAFAVDFLTSNGVLILDNSERYWYQEAKDMMLERGFKRLDFKGMGPIVGYEFCSSVFYRADNCLGI
jgi:hypothetical protein